MACCSENRKETEREPLCCASGDGLLIAIRSALTDREHVVMVRVSDEILGALDMLVESTICRSRSSAATFMIREGIKANERLFSKVSEATEQISTLRETLRESLGAEGFSDEDSDQETESP
jgi:predicted transcriptional regulator